MLGLSHPSEEPYKFVNRYANLAQPIISAVEQYIAEVKDGTFPAPKHSYFLPQKTCDQMKGDNSILKEMHIDPITFFDAIKYDTDSQQSQQPNSPEIIKSAAELRRKRNEMSSQQKVAFIPFLGGLHEGHLALIEEAKRREPTHQIWCSLFVNPTQFNDPEDYLKYPYDAQEDIDALTKLGVDVIFTPSVHDMYPHLEGADGDTQKQPFIPFVNFEEVETQSEEGRVRPGHFKGVGTVVTTLFSWIRPDIAVFGQKDFMQCVLIRNLCRQFFPDSEIVIHPTVREEDGLAMSSRNRKLNKTERDRAPLIHRTLSHIGRHLFDCLDAKGYCAVDKAIKIGMEYAKQRDVDLEYISFHKFADGSTLHENEDLIHLLEREQIVISIAGAVGPSTRLIDNIVIGGDSRHYGSSDILYETVPEQLL